MSNTIHDTLFHQQPSYPYLRFVAQYLLRHEEPASLTDPFAIDLPGKLLESAYIQRRSIEEEISQVHSQVILGPEGSGKSTLFRKLPTLLLNRDSQPLVVHLPLAQIGLRVVEKELQAGEVSLLSPKILTHYLYNAYWEHLLCDTSRRTRHLPHLRKDREWMETLRWFYQHYPPFRQQIPGEFELMTWLESQPARELVVDPTSEDTLRALVHFITRGTGLRQYGLAKQGPYRAIYFLIDGGERLSHKAFSQFILDLEKLYSLYLNNVYYKLFLNDSWRDQIERMGSVRRGEMSLFSLPLWTPKNLRTLLRRRLESGWADVHEGSGIFDDWGKLIPEDILKPPAQARLESIITEAATNIEQEEQVASPIRALAIARGLVAAFALIGQDERFSAYTVPLDVSEVQQLAQSYWSGG